MKRFLLLLSLMAALAGCDRESHEARVPDWIDTLQVSPRLENALAGAMDRWHAGGNLDLPLARDLITADSLMLLLDIRDRRDSAVEDLMARILEQPDHSLWAWTGFTMLTSREKERLDSIRAARGVGNSPVLGFLSQAWRGRRMNPGAGSLDSMISHCPFQNEPHRWYIRHHWADAAWKDGKEAQAVDSLLAWLGDFHAMGGSALEARAWITLGDILQAQGDANGSLRCQAMGLRFAEQANLSRRKHQARVELSSKLGSLGYLEIAHGELDSALHAAMEAEALQPALFASFYLQELRGNLGDLYGALDAARIGVEICKRQMEPYNIPMMLLNQVGCHLKLGQLDSCPPLLEEAKAFTEMNPVAVRDWIVPTVESEYWFYRGDYAKADSLWTHAESIQVNPSLEYRSNQLLLLAKLGLEHGHHAMVLEALDGIDDLESLPTGSQPGKDFRFDEQVLRARLYAHMGAFDRAEQAVSRADDVFGKDANPAMQMELAHVRGLIRFVAGDATGAIPHFQDALRIAQESRKGAEVGREKLFLAQSHAGLGETSRARQILRGMEADFDAFPSLRIVLLKELLLGELDLIENDPRTALGRTERILGSGEHRPPPDLQSRFRLLEARALAASGQKRRAAARFRRLLDRYGSDVSPLQRSELRLLMGDEIRQACTDNIHLLAGMGVPADSTLMLLGEMRALTEGRKIPRSAPRNESVTLYFLLSSPASYVWTQSCDGLELLALPDRNRIVELVEDWNRQIASGSAESSPLSEQLAAWMLGSLAGRWPAGQTLHLVLDDVLHDMPWAILPWEDGLLIDHGPLAERALPFWPVEGVSVVSNRLLALGFDPGGEGLDRLAHASQEARGIAEHWPAESDLVTEGLSGEGLLRLLTREPYRAIHLATHSRVHPSIAGRSYLSFPGPGGESQTLAAEEIAKRLLSAELVYLSCCDGGRGVTAPGGAVSNLARSFQDAGAREVIASPVPISDEASRILAQNFYRHWNQGLCAADALRVAQLELRHSRSSWSRPKYWAYTRLTLRD